MRHIVPLVVLVTLPLRAQIEVVPEGDVDPERLERIYDDYVGAEFEVVAAELARWAGRNPVRDGFIPPAVLEEPWKHSLALVLAMAWRHHTDFVARGEDRGRQFPVLMEVLEDETVGPGRSLALAEIRSRLSWGWSAPTGIDRSRAGHRTSDGTLSRPRGG